VDGWVVVGGIRVVAGAAEADEEVAAAGAFVVVMPLHPVSSIRPAAKAGIALYLFNAIS
jgi:hypothetical protein